MLEQGKWKDGAPVPSKEFHDRFEESLKLIEKKVGEKAPAGARDHPNEQEDKAQGQTSEESSCGLYSRRSRYGSLYRSLLSESGMGFQSAADRAHI